METGLFVRKLKVGRLKRGALEFVFCSEFRTEDLGLRSKRRPKEPETPRKP